MCRPAGVRADPSPAPHAHGLVRAGPRGPDLWASPALCVTVHACAVPMRARGCLRAEPTGPCVASGLRSSRHCGLGVLAPVLSLSAIQGLFPRGLSRALDKNPCLPAPADIVYSVPAVNRRIPDWPRPRQRSAVLPFCPTQRYAATSHPSVCISRRVITVMCHRARVRGTHGDPCSPACIGPPGSAPPPSSALLPTGLGRAGSTGFAYRAPRATGQVCADSTGAVPARVRRPTGVRAAWLRSIRHRTGASGRGGTCVPVRHKRHLPQGTCARTRVILALARAWRPAGARATSRPCPTRHGAGADMSDRTRLTKRHTRTSPAGMGTRSIW